MYNTNRIRTFSEDRKRWIVRLLTIAVLFFIYAPPTGLKM